MKGAVDPEVLDCFWRLSDLHSSKRLDGATRLASHCSGKKSVREYCLDRLVQGLASSRLASRLGYSLAIGALLENGSLNLAQLHKLLDEKLSLSGTDGKPNAIGQTLAYSAALCSNLPKPIEADELDFIIKKLLSIRESNAHLRVVIDDAIISYAAKLENLLFKRCVWPHLQIECSADIEDITLRGLWMLLMCHQHFPKLILNCPLSKYDTLFSEQLFPMHIKLLSGSSGFHAGLHPAVVYLIDCLLADTTAPSVLELYWNKVVVEGLSRHATEKVRHLSVSMSTKAISRATINEDQLLAIVSKPLLESIYKCCSSKYSAKAMQKAWREFLTVLKQKIDGQEVSGRVVTGILSSMNLVSLSFDRCCQVTLSDVLVAHLPIDAIDEYLNNRLELVAACDGGDRQDWLGALRQVQQLTFKLRDKPKLTLKTMKKLTKILSHSMSKAADADDVAKVVAKERADSIRSSLHSIIDWLLTVIHRKGHRTQVLLTNHDMNVLLEWIKKSYKKLPDSSQKSIENVLPKIEKLLQSDQLEGAEKAFAILLTYTSAWLVIPKDDSDRKKFNEALKELDECYCRFDGSIEVGGGPAWIDVLMDLMLSLMSHANRHVRHALPPAMHYLAPILTYKNLEPVLQALNVKEIDTLVEDEDDTDTENGSDNDGDSDIEELQGEGTLDDDDSTCSDVINDSESEEEEDEEAEDAEDIVDPALTASVKNALGEAAAHTDMDESDFSDDTMLRLDDMIAKAFKSHLGRRPNRKNKQAILQQARDYRLKCFDLVAMVVESQPHPHLIINLLAPLLRIGNEALRSKDQQLMYKRTTDIIGTIKNLKMDWKLVDKKVLVGGYESLYEASEALTNPIFQVFSGDCAAFLLSKDIAKHKLIDILLKELECYMEERACRIPSAMFEIQIQKHPNILFGILDRLGSFAFKNDKVRPIRKSEAVIWSRLLLRRDLTNEHKDSCTLKDFAAGLKQMIINLECGLVSDLEIKPRFMAECIMTLLYATHLQERDIFLDDELKQSIEKLSRNRDCATVKAVSTVLKKLDRSLPSICNQILNGNSPKKSRKRQKRRSVTQNGSKQIKLHDENDSS